MELSREKEFLSYLEKHKGILHKVACLYMNTAEDRADLQQEIIIQLWKSYETFKGDSQFSTWMYRVALNTAITFFKKERKYVEMHSAPVGAETGMEEYSKEKDRQLEIFYEAAQELNAIEKALIFYFMEGHSHKEIGLQMGITEINARVKLNRTKEKLQKIIQNKGYEF